MKAQGEGFMSLDSELEMFAITLGEEYEPCLVAKLPVGRSLGKNRERQGCVGFVMGRFRWARRPTIKLDL